MNIITLLSGPVIGSVIGYGTNYIAVKMLFHPRKEIKIAGHRLPFTPGIIPKRKNEVGAAAAKAVSEQLLTNESIKSFLTDEKIKKNSEEKILTFLKDKICIYSIKDEIIKLSSEEKYETLTEKIDTLITDKIIEIIMNADLKSIISSLGSSALKEKFSGPMAALILNDNLINSVSESIAEKIKEYVSGEGRNRIYFLIDSEVEKLFGKEINELIEDFGVSDENIKYLIGKMYDGIVDYAVDSLNLGKKAEEIIKLEIEKMSSEEIEKLVLNVMNKELKSIVNLGAVIGFVLGIITTIINMI